jgi:acetylglutamate synthase
MICRLCHKEGQKSFQCKANTGDKQKQKLKQKPTRKISNTYIKKVDKKVATPYLIKKKKNGKVIAIKACKQVNKGKGAKRIWVPKKIISTMKSTKKVWIPRGK